MALSAAFTHDSRINPPSHWSDNPHVCDIVDDYEKMQGKLKELEEENAWLRFYLDKYSLLDRADTLLELFRKAHQQVIRDRYNDIADETFDSFYEMSSQN